MVSAPQAFVPAFIAAWAARDGDALAALFAEDADFVNVVGIWWEDRPAIARAHSHALHSFFAKTRLVAGRLKIRDLGDVAIIHARMALTGQVTPGGEAAGARTTILSFVLHRRDGGWTCVSAQNTDVVPGMETHLAGDGTFGAVDYR
ncbi:SnoaL-like domain protein [Jannaschia seosinensis]|uniref:SnoaL-like domain protein n=1 Tax=Jannaschia seosinensis TaxID=313367 RepID=A0A0M7B6K4_9RHOB|nr:SgcJ/EcaC family oxidoreductase [Jannaschia seosinensis]CUH15719.1 SnoaL-like domain protein [Jannaschia seosinensis]